MQLCLSSCLKDSKARFCCKLLCNIVRFGEIVTLRSDQAEFEKMSAKLSHLFKAGLDSFEYQHEDEWWIRHADIRIPGNYLPLQSLLVVQDNFKKFEEGCSADIKAAAPEWALQEVAHSFWMGIWLFKAKFSASQHGTGPGVLRSCKFMQICTLTYLYHFDLSCTGTWAAKHKS